MKSRFIYYFLALSFIVVIAVMYIQVKNTQVSLESPQEASIFTAIKNFFFPPPWSPDDCPPNNGQYGLVYNGGFEFGAPDNTPLTVPSVDSEAICGWVRNYSTTSTWNTGVRYFSFAQQNITPLILHEDVYFLTNDNNNQRFVGLGVSEHFYSHQSHDYVRQTLNGLSVGDSYVLRFDFSIERNTTWGWPPQVGGMPNLGIAVLLLSDEQMTSLLMSGDDWIIGQYGIYFQDEFRDYSSSEEFIEAVEVLSQSENINVIYISETNEFSRTLEVGDVMEFEQSFIAPSEEFNNLVILPVGYDPEYAANTQWKAKAVLTLDNVEIENNTIENTDCSIVYTGSETIYAYYESGLVPITTGQLIFMSELQNYNPSIGAGVDTIIVAALGEGVVDIISPGGAMLSQSQLDSLFDFSGLEHTMIFGSGGHHYFEYTCPEDCSMSVYDLNNDVMIDDEDFDIFMLNFGLSCESQDCVGDFNNDGVVNILDLNLMIQNTGESCEGGSSENISIIESVFLSRGPYNYMMSFDVFPHEKLVYTLPKFIEVTQVVSDARQGVVFNDVNNSIEISSSKNQYVKVFVRLKLPSNMCDKVSSSLELGRYRLCE